MFRELIIVVAAIMAFAVSLFLFTHEVRPAEPNKEETREKLDLAKEIMSRFDKKSFMERVEKSTDVFTTKVKDLPPGWKEEYIKLWNMEGWDAVQIGAQTWLVNHLSKEELLRIKNKDKIDDNLKQKLVDFTEFTRKHGLALGSLYRRTAEKNLLEKNQKEQAEKQKKNVEDDD
jgi:hypothetical protein